MGVYLYHFLNPDGSSPVCDSAEAETAEEAVRVGASMLRRAPERAALEVWDGDDRISILRRDELGGPTALPFQYAVIHKRAGWCVLREGAELGVYPTFEQALEVAQRLAEALCGAAGGVQLDVQSPSGELRRLSV